MVVGIAAALLVYGMVDTTSAALRRDRDVDAALGQALQALIGRAAADDNRPGSLPCPDTNNDGSAENFVGSDCPSYVGYLPWRTLGLPDLRDASGERLWYVLSPQFRDNSAAEPINSDTKGNLTVYLDSPATTITTEAVAVIFAPGAATGAQNRDPGATALCPTTGTTIARNLCAANYLETAGGTNNASATGPYIQAQATSTFNDRLLVMTTSNLIPVVEIRVAREMLRILSDYRTRTPCCNNWGGTTRCYPWADTSDGQSDADPYNSGNERNRGRIPIDDAAPYQWGTNPCGAGTLPTVPSWFLNNNWHAIVYYSAARDFLGPNDNGYPCATCVSSTLTVDGNNKEVVILMPGPHLGTPPRSPVGLSDPTYWQYYLDDAANYDHSDDTYVAPISTLHTRDRIFTIP